MGTVTTETERRLRKNASEDIRKAIRSLKAAGDHGTAYHLEQILKRLTERRAADNKAAGLA